MKKLVFVFAAAACMLLSAATAKAQLYFGGSLGFSSTTRVTTGAATDNTVSGSSYKFVPEVGFRINDRMAVGGRVGYGNGANTFGSVDPNDGNPGVAAGIMATDLANRTRQSIDFSFAPYFRYTIIDGRRFSIFADAVVCYGMTTTKADQGNGTWADTGKTTYLETGIEPGFSIDLGSHFAVIGHLGFLGYQSIKQPNTTTSHIGFGVSTNNLTLGFIYSL